MKVIRLFGLTLRWSSRLVMLHRTRCLFIWRRDPKFQKERPVWNLKLPFGIVIEKWRTR